MQLCCNNQWDWEEDSYFSSLSEFKMMIESKKNVNVYDEDVDNN